ncbi:Hypothetical protein SCF082_LOCUS9638 [Durusdinium trenchii]|uniref:Uncharacterized protein n=1 Tax=Durusdinium trenchii TaxID=1381693 RepID=A0ABP0J0Q5_9DINO
MGKRKVAAMENVEAPAAETPVQPKALVATLELRLNDCNEELLEQQVASRQMHEVYGSARRQTFILQSALLRGDRTTVSETLESLAQVPKPEDVVGEIWQKLEVRFRLAEELCNFSEGYLTCLQLKAFFDTGVLTVPLPDVFKCGIGSIDDERYLLSLISTVRELERFAVGRARVLDLPSIRTAWTVAQCVEQAMLQFDFRNSGALRQRYDSLKYVVKRLETIVYEVDLALQRHSAASGPAEAPKRTRSAEPDGEALVKAVDLGLLNSIKERYDNFTDMREQVIKRSRDIGKGAKNAVYALQRADYPKAEVYLSHCAKEASTTFKDFISAAPNLRPVGFSAALEEMAEAVAYRAFLKDSRILNKAELQAASGLLFELTLQEYLGGILDLTGEVGRLAIRQATQGREAVRDVELCLACVDGVCSGVQELVYLPGVGKKMPAVKATLLKIEGVLYELALLSHAGLHAKAPEPQREDETRATDEP